MVLLKDTKGCDPSLDNERDAKFEFFPSELGVFFLYTTHDSITE